jgi:hypothetical protein
MVAVSPDSSGFTGGGAFRQRPALFKVSSKKKLKVKHGAQPVAGFTVLTTIPFVGGGYVWVVNP